MLLDGDDRPFETPIEIQMLIAHRSILFRSRNSVMKNLLWKMSTEV